MVYSACRALCNRSVDTLWLGAILYYVYRLTLRVPCVAAIPEGCIPLECIPRKLIFQCSSTIA